MQRILIVDDEEKIREVIREFAEFEGYEAYEATDGMSANKKCCRGMVRNSISAKI